MLAGSLESEEVMVGFIDSSLVADRLTYHVLSFYDLSPSVIQQQKLRREESVRGLYCAHSLTATTSFEHVSPDGATVGVLLDETETQVCMVDDLLIPWLQRTPREGTPTGCPPSVTSWC